jgi:hypothetical protein
MRQIPAILGLATVVAWTSACGGLSPSQSATGAPGAVSAQSTTPPAVKVDQGLLTVDVTIRRSLLDPDGKTTDEQILQAAKDKGMKAVVNADQTVTYTMTRTQQKQMLDGLRTSMRDSITKLVDGGQTSITAVDVSDDMTSFTAKVDGARYGMMDAFYALAFYVQGGLFQQFSGVAAEKVDVQVQFVDDKSGKVLNSSSYRDWLKRQSG